MHIWNFKKLIEAVELAVEAMLVDENSHNRNFIELQHLEWSIEFTVAFFLSRLQASYHVNCVPNDNQIQCGKVNMVTWLGDLTSEIKVLLTQENFFINF